MHAVKRKGVWGLGGVGSGGHVVWGGVGWDGAWWEGQSMGNGWYGVGWADVGWGGRKGLMMERRRVRGGWLAELDKLLSFY